VLQELRKRNMLVDIELHQFNVAHNTWMPPLLLSKPEDWSKLPLYRRSKQNDNLQTDDKRYKWLGMTESDRENWKTSAARPYLSYGQMKKVIHHWRQFSKRAIGEITPEFSGGGSATE
jgi:hypothetical protein